MIISYFYPHLGGAEQQSLRLAEQLIRRGVPVCVLTRKFKGLPAHEVVRGIPVCRAIRTLPWGKWFAVTYMLSVLWFLWRRRHTYDIIHCHLLQGFHSVVAILFKVLFQKKVVIKVGATGPLSDFVMLKNVFLGDFLLKKIIRADKLVTVCSQSTAEALQAGFTFHQIAQIPNGVDTNQFQPFSPSNNQTNITFIGRLDMMKGVQVLLEAFKTVKEAGVIAHLSIIGDGPDRETLIGRARQAGIADSVSFCGEIVDIKPFLEKTAVFVLPSLSEGLSNVLLEAMACGLPIVATRVGGNIDLILDGENGILVETEKSNQLSVAMKKILQDKALAKKLGSEARKTVEQRFSLISIADRYLSLYRELTGV
jgi:glycosyltransferase involved in cell wall biosynthesis